ncbi:MAG: pilin [Candidatus Saccharibacteria bacterium]|nr:pilin [Candidatus Saccharibacteria bacterium]
MKKILVFVALILATFTTFNLISSPSVSAAASTETFLGMPAWNYGLDTSTITNTEGIKQAIVMIVSNVLLAITVAATYLILAYTIYGGYLYIFSNGDPGKAAGGKKTLTRAFIGMAVVASTYIILNAIRIAFMGANGNFAANCTTSECLTATDFVTNILGWFIGIAGIVAAIFLVVGGIGYVTSAGDASKLQKSKNTIMYALIGLAIVGLAQVIVVFVSNMAREATKTSYLDNQTLIAKEYHEN